MQEDQSGISIINRNGGQLTGEKAQAFPIKLISSNTAIKFFVIGLISTLIIIIVLIYIVQRQVVVVDVIGKADNYTEYNIN